MKTRSVKHIEWIFKKSEAIFEREKFFINLNIRFFVNIWLRCEKMRVISSEKWHIRRSDNIDDDPVD
jgi:hypothetical protein